MDAVKDRLLNVYKTGRYTQLTPKESLSLLKLTNDYLSQTNPNSINQIELFTIYELNFFLLLMTKRDLEADSLLKLLLDKFDGINSERLIILRSYYLESSVEKREDLVIVIKYLNDSIEALVDKANKQPSNVTNGITRSSLDFYQTQKRIVGLSYKLNLDKLEYIDRLNTLLEMNPLDTSILVELSDIYESLDQLDMSMHCIKDSLVNQPFAYNLFAKLGELYYMQYAKTKRNSNSGSNSSNSQLLKDGLKYFLRSLELNDNYLRSIVGSFKSLQLIEERSKEEELLYKFFQDKLLGLQKSKELINSNDLNSINKIL